MNLCVCFGSFSDGVAFACTERGFFPNASGHSILFPSLCTFNLLNCCICRARSNGSCENHGTCQGHCCRQHEAALWWTPDFFISLIQFTSPTPPRTQKTTSHRHLVAERFNSSHWSFEETWRKVNCQAINGTSEYPYPGRVQESLEKRKRKKKC